MFVFCCESMKTGSICRTICWLAVVSGRIASIDNFEGTLGSAGVAVNRCWKNGAVSASFQTRMIQSALATPAVHPPQEAHHWTCIVPLTVVGSVRNQVQLGSWMFRATVPFTPGTTGPHLAAGFSGSRFG